MTGRKKKRRTHPKGKRRGRAAGLAIYVRCRFCGREFEGNSRALTEWSEHLILCEKKHSRK